MAPLVTTLPAALILAETMPAAAIMAPLITTPSVAKNGTLNNHSTSNDVCQNNSSTTSNHTSNHSNTNNKKKTVKHQCEVLSSTKNKKYEQLSLQILSDGFWLTDEHIDHGQWLLSKQFPEGKGLHSVLAFEGENPKVEKGLNDFVQIINVGAQHWVTVSNIGCEENSVNVYNSLFMKKTRMTDKSFIPLWHNCLTPVSQT